MTIEILPVSDKAMLRRFIRVPSEVHKHDAAWITPLMMEREEAFSPKDNEFLRRAEVRFWIARRDGRDVGRISAQIDPLAQRTDAERIGHFGCLSAESCSRRDGIRGNLDGSGKAGESGSSSVGWEVA